MKSRMKFHFIPVLLLFGTAFIISLTTFYVPFVNTKYSVDQSIYSYVGWALTEGKTLYIDVWDNKGPLLYFIEAAGILINYWHGIYFLELFTLFFSLVFLYKTALLFSDRKVSVFCAIFCIIPIIRMFVGDARGNITEEYALFFSSWGFYYIAKFFKQQCCLKKYQMILTGICIGAVFMIRLNILAFLGCGVLGTVIVLIKRKEYKTLGVVFTFSLLGFLASLLPFVIYLVQNNALGACLDAAYFGTLNAFEAEPFCVRILKPLRGFVGCIVRGGCFPIGIFLVLFPCYAYHDKAQTCDEKNFRSLQWIYFWAIIVNFFANTLSGEGYLHYFVTFIPIMLIPTMWIIERYCTLFFDKTHKPKLMNFFAVILFIFLDVTCFSFLKTGLEENFATSANTYELDHFILENTQATDEIQLMGNPSDVGVYYRTKRLSASNYFYCPTGKFTDAKIQEFADKILIDITKKLPKIVAFSDSTYQDNFISHVSNPEQFDMLINEKYTIKELSSSCIVYMRK